MTCTSAVSKTTNFPFPGLDQLAINSFVLHGNVPVLVDTVPVIERECYLAAFRSVIDPADLRWIWLTHPDADLTGALGQLLADYPDLKVITTFRGIGILSTSDPLPMDRVHLVNPGQRITLGRRTLTAIQPLTFDNPSTTGFIDVSSGVLFPADCFGALLQDFPQNAADLTDADLHDGQVFWTTIDSPWLHQIERGMLARELNAVASLEPSLILSSHLPAAPGHLLDRFLTALAAVPGAAPFVGPDQVALEAILVWVHAGAH